MIRKGSKTLPFNDPKTMVVIKDSEQCAEQNIDCNLCPRTRMKRCRRRFDIGMTKYIENAKHEALEKLRLDIAEIKEWRAENNAKRY